MIWVALSAGFVGLVHSLAPGHWLPVVLMAKARRWDLRQAVSGALVAAAGHIAISVVLAVGGIEIAAHLVESVEARVERYSGAALLVFGLAYSLWAFFRHSGCHGHTHHGPDPRRSRSPYLFLLSLGFSPCIAALPLFAAAAPGGAWAVAATMAAFAGGVLLALVGSTVLVSLGFMRLDHPVFEHYGDVITGLGVAAIGAFLFLHPGH